MMETMKKTIQISNDKHGDAEEDDPDKQPGKGKGSRKGRGSKGKQVKDRAANETKTDAAASPVSPCFTTRPFFVIDEGVSIAEFYDEHST